MAVAEWDRTKTYSPGDLATRAGQLYRAVVGSRGQNPQGTTGTQFWSLEVLTPASALANTATQTATVLPHSAPVGHMQRDPAMVVKDALVGLAAPDQSWAADVCLEVADDYQPVPGLPTLLVADDGGGAVNGGAWLAGRDLLRVTLRLTAFARGRTEAREVVDAAVRQLRHNRPTDVARIENIPAILDTRDRDTGAYLASIILPVLIRP